tara:strand:- start:14592 stop:15545 length:954 start_codon:yes stop_codon:yes gene_type:complete
MEVITKYKDVGRKYQNAVVAIGNFDGVHKGHLELIMRVKNAASNNNKAGIVSFFPHPRSFFTNGNGFSQIMEWSEKEYILSKLDIDFLYKIKFDKQLSQMSPEAFFYNVLLNGIGVSHIIVGWDFKFGNKRTGNTSILEELCIKNQIGFECISPQADGQNRIFSSTLIRNLLESGDIKSANEILGYYWFVFGNVISGEKKGSKMGYPTINTRMNKNINLAHGIYATHVYIANKRYMGSSYYGRRPTFDGNEPFLETYIFDFNDDIYDQSVKIEFIDFIRYDNKYETLEDLKKQMKIDCDNVLKKLQIFNKEFSLLDN